MCVCIGVGLGVGIGEMDHTISVSFGFYVTHNVSLLATVCVYIELGLGAV